jgi:hypothetical protein
MSRTIKIKAAFMLANISVIDSCKKTKPCFDPARKGNPPLTQQYRGLGLSILKRFGTSDIGR